jgi:glycerol kinase
MIQDDGFYDMPEFSRWVKSLDGVPKVAKDAVDREYHMTVARKFLLKYRLTLQKHIVEQWTNGSKTHYMLAADPDHASALAKILVDARTELDGVERQNDEYYKVPDEEITLPYYHTMTRGPIVCNLRKTMNVLTDNVSFEEVVLQPFVAQQWDQIKMMADQSEPVNIWNDDQFVKIR